MEYDLKHMSAFMDFWMEKDVDILDLSNIDRAIKAKISLSHN